MSDPARRTMPSPAPNAERARHGAPPAATSLTSAPHDGLLLLAALTGHRGLLTAWLRVERGRGRADAAGGAWGG